VSFIKLPVLVLLALAIAAPASADGLLTTHRIPADLANQAVAAAVA
jgi:hypothetical protein